MINSYVLTLDMIDMLHDRLLVVHGPLDAESPLFAFVKKCMMFMEALTSFQHTEYVVMLEFGTFL